MEDDIASPSPQATERSVAGVPIEGSPAATARKWSSYAPVASSWNSEQFNASLNTNLLTFSVAPLTHVMQAVGTTIHHHDILLQELAKQLHKVDRVQEEMSKHTASPSISNDDLLAKLGEIEKRVNDVEANAEPIQSREELLTNKLGMVRALEDRAEEQDASIGDVKNCVDQMSIRLSDFVTTVTLDLMKEALLNDVQAMIKDAIAQLVTSQDARYNALQDQLTQLHGNNSDNDSSDGDDDEVLSDGGDVLRPARVPPAETTMVTHTHKKSKRSDGTSSTRMLFDPAQKMHVEQLDQQLKQLTVRLRDVEVDRATWHDRVEGIHDQVVQCNLDAGQFRHDMISAFDELAGKVKEAHSTETPSVTPLPVPSRKFDDEVQRHSDRIERLTKQIGDLNLAHGSDHTTTESNAQAVKALQEDVRKLKGQVDAFEENQSLMQGLSGGGGGDGATPDLSMVFGKLAEMRQTQTDATDELRQHLNALDEWAKGHKTQWQNAKHQEEGKAQLDLRQLDAQLELEKDGLHHQLHLQEHIMGQVTDWLHAIPIIRKDLEKPDSHENKKMIELQTMLRQYYRALPGVAALQATSNGLHGTLQNLHHMFLRVQDSVAGLGVDLATRDQQLQTLNTLLSTLDKHNEGLLKQYDNARAQMDELWNLWQKRLHMDADNRLALLSKEITEVALLKPKVVVPSPPQAPSGPEHHSHVDKKMSLSAQAMALGEGSDAVKRLEQLLLTCCRRLDGFEDDLRVLTRNVHAYRGDMTDRVTEGHLSKLKFQIFAELAKIHAVLGSSKFQGGAATASIAKVYDDSEIKSTLDVQAELIASLCLELKKEKEEASEKKSVAPPPLAEVIDSDKVFNAKLESITEKVAEMFVTLEVQRSSSQPRNIIPAYNPTLLLEAFAQNIEAKLALTQDLTKKDIERIKAELGDNVRRRVTKAMEAMRDHIPSTEPTTAVGTIPGMVCCIACSRPVRFDTNTGDVQKEVNRTTLGLPEPDEDDELWERESDPEFVYRAGFRMPVIERKNVLPLLVSPRVPPSPRVKGGSVDKGKSRRFIKGSTRKVDSLMREVEDLDHDTLNAERQVDYKKVNDARKPIAPLR
ncbi:hypothetical protein H310_05588 [Aphanomyces invadans]|uniref:Uncharacterized protein n=1 Tax=Aphanomyces invadans TaxID=157072 RepID=A0A024U9R3_9STRA|nr:hypothetical protein H310_05588 [Aphanomyces invadans]ETW03171.1 hypothetical protein H310_05588 [Aphanomyces invadans]|eukprot:XP_008868555.1 hypothetical protein H310_05588 [Aphanomyces invadans]